MVSSFSARVTIGLVQQGIWDMPLESMPLASAYLKAMALADPVLQDRTDIRIHNFRGGVTNAAIANAIFGGDLPDLLAFSVLGWNYRSFGELAATYKQLKPDGWVVFGGPTSPNRLIACSICFPMSTSW